MLSTVREMIRHWGHLLAYSWSALGPRVLVRDLLRYGSDPEARNVDSGFDARFGTDTNAELTPCEAQIPRVRRGQATMYLPTMDRDLDAILTGLGWPEARLRQTTFVDVGSGKGRVVFLAAMRRFREVVGVELSPVLHAVAEANLARMQRAGVLRSTARLALGDATELEVPSGPLIAYLYHPFRDEIAAHMMSRVIVSLAAAPRPAAILYGHPTLQRCIDPQVFAVGDVFRQASAGARATRRFRVGWSIWTNQAWLERAHALRPDACAATGT